MSGLRKAAIVPIAILGLAGAGTAAGAKAPPPRLVRISTDTTAAPGSQHATEVEPDAAAVGSKVVATFQIGRNFGGGAGAIGFSTSRDAGLTWHAGILPLPATFVSDPVVAYDAFHARWLIASLSILGGESVIFVSGSPDGVSWEAPPSIAVSYPQSPLVGTSLDKEWITCDNGPASPFRARCYLAYTDIAHDTDPAHPGSHIGIQSSTDGGRTWSQPVLLAVNANMVSPGVQPVVRPNGELVVVFDEDGLAEAVRSTDGGATFSERERVAKLTFHRPPFEPVESLRALSLPSVAVDAGGTVYAAWFDCRFRPGCVSDDIVISRSPAPGRWTTPRRIPLGSLRSITDLALPDLAVDPRSRGARARLALTYYSVNSVDCADGGCLLDVFLVTSRTAGNRWSKPRRLNPTRIHLEWLAETSAGRMVGDYVATVFAGTRVVSIHTQARPPRAGRFDEAIYAFSEPLP